MSKHPTETYDAFCMYNLADSVANNDWTLQDTALNYEGWTAPKLYDQTLKRLKSIDFSEVDIITIAYGTNDFTSKKVLDNLNNAYDTTTFAGALRYSIDTISAAYPHIEIVICTPIYRFWMDEDGNFLYDSDTYELNGQKLTNFVQQTKDVASEYSLFLIDNYNGTGIVKDNRTDYFPKTSGVHPNAAGRKKIAENIAKELYKQFG